MPGASGNLGLAAAQRVVETLAAGGFVRRREGMMRVRSYPVSREINGITYVGTYTVEDEMISVRSHFGTKATQLGGSHPACLAWLLLRETVLRGLDRDMSWQPISTAPAQGQFLVASRGYTRDDGTWEWNLQVGTRQPGGAVFVHRNEGYPTLWHPIVLPTKR